MLLGLLAGAFALAAPASAHVEVTGSTPRDGARLAKAPSTVTIRFNDTVVPSFIHVAGPSGQRVDTGAVTHPGGNDDFVTVALRSDLPDGSYVAQYRIVADDGHPVAGEISFVVGSGALKAPGAEDTSDSVVSAALDASRWISWAGFALLGGGWLLLTLWPEGRDERPARRLVQVGWIAAIVGAVLEVLLEGAYVAGSGIGTIFHGSLVTDTLKLEFGALHVVRLALLLLLAVLPPRVFFWPLMVGIAYTFSAVGHPRTTDPVWLSIGFDMLHLLAIAAWIGGVVMILVGVLPRAADLAHILAVYSKVAFSAVSVIALTGTYAAVRGVGSWRALLHTEYGLLVSAKVLGFLGLLAVGNLARTVIARRALTTTDREQLRRCVLVETTVAAVVLGFAAVLVSQPRGAEALALALGGVR